MRYFIRFAIFLAIVPMALQALLVSDLLYEESLHPNMQTAAKITLYNNTERTEKVQFKLYDYSCNSDGQHFFEEISSAHTRSNASWIRLAAQQLTLAPGERQNFYYTIQAPSRPDLKGSYWSVLMIEPVDEVKSELSLDGFQINIKVRYAHHIVTHIGQSKAKINIFKKELTDIEGQKRYRVCVANEGEQYLNPQLILKLFDMQGNLVSTLDGGKERLYPGCSQSYYIDVQNVKDQIYKGFLILDNGDHHLFGEHLTYPK